MFANLSGCFLLFRKLSLDTRFEEVREFLFPFPFFVLDPFQAD